MTPTYISTRRAWTPTEDNILWVLVVRFGARMKHLMRALADRSHRSIWGRMRRLGLRLRGC